MKRLHRRPKRITDYLIRAMDYVDRQIVDGKEIDYNDLLIRYPILKILSNAKNEPTT